MSNWFVPQPEHEYMERAWEKAPYSREHHEHLRTTKGIEEETAALLERYTPDQLAYELAYERKERTESYIIRHALWLEHLADKNRLRESFAVDNAKAWAVFNKVIAAMDKGRKTVRIDDLMGDTDE